MDLHTCRCKKATLIGLKPKSSRRLRHCKAQNTRVSARWRKMRLRNYSARKSNSAACISSLEDFEGQRLGGAPERGQQKTLLYCREENICSHGCSHARHDNFSHKPYHRTNRCQVTEELRSMVNNMIKIEVFEGDALWHGQSIYRQ